MDTTNKDFVTRSEALAMIERNLPVTFGDSEPGLYHEPLVERFMKVQVGDPEGDAYVIETIGFIHPDLVNDEAFWNSLADDEGVASVLVSESEPHSGIVCDVTDLVIEEPFFFVDFAVDPTACDNDDPYVQGAENALFELLEQAEQYAIDGWSCDSFDISATIAFARQSGKPDLTLGFRARAIRNGDDIAITLSVDGEDGATTMQQYHDPVGDWDSVDDDENSPRYRFLDVLKDFFYIGRDTSGMTYKDVKGSMGLRSGTYARRFGSISRFDG